MLWDLINREKLRRALLYLLYVLLCLLAHTADKVLPHQFILHEIWGTATKSDLASLRVFMGTLRKKIESDPAHPRYIQTHVGIGYRLVIQG